MVFQRIQNIVDDRSSSSFDRFGFALSSSDASGKRFMSRSRKYWRTLTLVYHREGRYWCSASMERARSDTVVSRYLYQIKHASA